MPNISSSNFNLTNITLDFFPYNYLIAVPNFSESFYAQNLSLSPNFSLDEIRNSTTKTDFFSDMSKKLSPTENKLSLLTAYALSRLPTFPFNFTVFLARDINTELNSWLLKHPHMTEVVARIKHCIEHQEKILNLSGLNLEVLDDKLIEIISHLTWVKALNLSFNGLTEIPENAFNQMSQLTSLYLNHNQLTQLRPELFNSLSNLMILSLHNNKLTQIPESIFRQTKQLSVLYLNHNLLTELPSTLFHPLTNLSSLHLSYNLLTALPESLFKQQTQLNLLFLENNQFTTLPPSIFDSLVEHIAIHLDANLDPDFYFNLPGTLDIYPCGINIKDIK